MSSISNSSISIESAALAAGDLVTISQRKPYLDSLQNKPLIESSNLFLGSQEMILQPEVVKWLTQMAISISKRGYKGISQSEGIFRGYLNHSLREDSSDGRARSFESSVS